MAQHPLLMPTFVAMADTLVDDFDLIDLLTLLTDRCVEIFGVSAAGLMLDSPQSEPRLVASTSPRMRAVELFELQQHEGPCIDCLRTGEPVRQLLESAAQWPRFAPMALRHGYVSALALPLRLRGRVIGAMNLFSTEEMVLDADDLGALQALTDVATIAIIQSREGADAKLLNEQLTEALHSRILIEQAKGALAERLGVVPDEAFAVLRAYARRRGLRLTAVARGLLDRTLTVTNEA